MDEYVHVFIHHGVSFEDDQLSSYKEIISELRCRLDKWKYFEVVGVIKELRYKEFGNILYKDPIFVMFTFSDDKYAQAWISVMHHLPKFFIITNGEKYTLMGEE